MINRQHLGRGRQPKVRFKSEYDANVQKQRNLDWRRERLTAYQCSECDGWHLGHFSSITQKEAGE
jgi:hypothetical protein